MNVFFNEKVGCCSEVGFGFIQIQGAGEGLSLIFKKVNLVSNLNLLVICWSLLANVFHEISNFASLIYHDGDVYYFESGKSMFGIG